MRGSKIKCVVVGDGAVGKTCMLISFTRNAFPKEYVPTVFDNIITTVQVDGSRFQMSLWDTAGQEEYDRIRPLSYSHSDIFIVCFSVDSQASFSNVRGRWMPELKKYSKKTPALLVGLKSDLRDDEVFKQHFNGRFVAKEEAQAMIQEFPNLKAYMECSALTQDGLHAVFEAAIRLVRKPSPMPTVCSCSLL